MMVMSIMRKKNTYSLNYGNEDNIDEVNFGLDNMQEMNDNTDYDPIFDFLKFPDDNEELKYPYEIYNKSNQNIKKEEVVEQGDHSSSESYSGSSDDSDGIIEKRFDEYFSIDTSTPFDQQKISLQEISGDVLEEETRKTNRRE